MRYPVALLARYYRRICVGDKIDLANYLDEIYRVLEVAGEGASVKVDINVILDELVTNIFTHGYDGRESEGEYVFVTVVITEERAYLRIRDRGAAFNILEHSPKLPESDNIEDLDLGGLGIFMALERVNEQSYKYSGGYNVLTMVKDLPYKFYRNDYFYRGRSINDANESLLANFMESRSLGAESMGWGEWRDLADILVSAQQVDGYEEHYVPLTILAKHQHGAYSVGSDYDVSVQVCCWGDKSKQALVCFGGILNTAERFVNLARSLASNYYVIGVSWVGRGKSDWLQEQDDYNLGVYGSHISAVLDYFDLREVYLLGSSLGGSAAIKYLSESGDKRVLGLILNDSGYHVPVGRRSRRSLKVGRHYVFRTPQELLRRYQLANRAEGSIPEAFLFLYSHWQTRAGEGAGAGAGDGLVYSHDYRCLASYRREACYDLHLRDEWLSLDLPILLLHGNLSSALSAEQCSQMLEDKESLKQLEIKHAGHTPPLTDEQIVGYIGGWLDGVEDISRQHTLSVNRHKQEHLFVFSDSRSRSAVIEDAPSVREFYMLRHGLTDFNVAGIRCGSEHDVCLNEEGIREVIRFGLYLRGVFAGRGDRDFGRIYCGGLQRLLKTSHIIGDISGIRDFQIDGIFNERWLGEYSGVEVGVHEADILAGKGPEGGESEDEFVGRVGRALDIVMYRVSACPVVVTSRGVIIRTLRQLVDEFDDDVKERNIIYHFSYDVAVSAWGCEKISVSSIDFSDSDYGRFLGLSSIG